MLPFSIRLLTGSDAGQLAVIHALSFEKAWSKDDFRLWLIDETYTGLGLYKGDRLIGFALFRQVMDEAELISIAIHPGDRGKNYAKELLMHSTTVLRSKGVVKIHLEVAQSNRAAKALYDKCGAKEVGRRKGYYRGEDAILMRISVDPEQDG